jgi:hypothetical protein
MYEFVTKLEAHPTVIAAFKSVDVDFMMLVSCSRAMQSIAADFSYN